MASGLGYYVWYAALRGLSRLRAATVQLSVPVIAAAGGVMLLGEPTTLRLLLAFAATLGGIAIVLRQPSGRRVDSLEEGGKDVAVVTEENQREQ